MITSVIETLKEEYVGLDMVREFGSDPYKMLVAVVLSARSRDEVTVPVARRLFSEAKTPYEMIKLSNRRIEELIRPIGFFRNKSKFVKDLSKALVERHDGDVPGSRDELMRLPGVGRKTANVILSQIFDQAAIAVDTHVHRIANRLGWIETQTPEETENELMSIIDRTYWRDINEVMVNHGQKICSPIRPKCGECPVSKWCEYYVETYKSEPKK